MTYTVIIRGGGDLASGIALRLFHSGFKVIILELPQPLTVRRSVAFSETVYRGEWSVEDVKAILAKSIDELITIINNDHIGVLVDPDGLTIPDLQPKIVIDARMRKNNIKEVKIKGPMLIGIGPGFSAGDNCDAVIESNRGHSLGRVIWNGSAQSDTGIPGLVHGIGSERVLYAPCNGQFLAEMEIGDLVNQGQNIAKVNETPITAPFTGLVRGLLHNGLEVKMGVKVGDVDPRQDKSLCKFVSEKALAIGGGVLEAILYYDHKNFFCNQKQ